MDTLTDRFLQLYKMLEYEGRRIYFPDSKENESIIGRLLNIPQLKPFKEDLDYCRVVRNFLTHNPKVNGVYPIVPSNEMIRLMEHCVNIVLNPMPALAKAVRAENIITATLQDRLMDVVKIMNTLTYTHIPVMENGKLIGIFSDNTVYTYMCSRGTINITDDTLLEDFKEFIPLDRHINEYFEFVPKALSQYEVEQLFKYNIRRQKLLAVVYITENGRRDEPILGMITPWDILSE